MLGVMPFFFIQSYVLQTFAKMVILVAAFGLFHGILVIPTFLMILGDIRASMMTNNEASSETGNGEDQVEPQQQQAEAETVENLELDPQTTGAVRDLTTSDGQYGPDLQPQSTNLM